MGIRKKKCGGFLSSLARGFRAPKTRSQARYPVGCLLENCEQRLLLAGHLTTVVWGGSPTVAVEGQWVVQTRNDADFAALAQNTGLQVGTVKSLGGNGFYMFTTPELSPAQVRTWYNANQGAIAALSPDGALVPTATYPNEKTVFPADWARYWYYENTGQSITDEAGNAQTGTPGADIEATKAWSLTTGSRNVIVAVMDTGIAFTIGNPSTPIDLLANLWRNSKEAAYGFGVGDGIDNDLNGIVDDLFGANFGTVPPTGITNGDDPDGHGTFVASEIGAVGNNASTLVSPNGSNQGIGLNWAVQMMDVQLDLNQGNTALVSEVVDAINYIVMERRVFHQNIVAINMSFGDIFFGSPSGNPALATLRNAIDLAGQSDIITVAAAGNSALDNDQFPFFPANGSGYLISVAATDNQDQLTGFSNYGANTVHLAAPGWAITGLDTSGGLTMMSGTSMAAPLVTGTLALMKAANPSANAQQLVNALLSSVDVLPNLQGKVITGGRLNTFRAVETIIGEQAPIGYVDTFNSKEISGWAFDKNAGKDPATIAIQIDGVFQPDLLADKTRNDLTPVVGSANHGFVFATPNLSAGLHTINVYVYNVKTDGTLGDRVLLYSNTINGNIPPIGSVDTLTATTVSGWVWDYNDGVNATAVRIDIDGVQGTAFAANMTRPDLTPVIGSSDHGFSYTLPALTAGPHRIDVWGIDNPTQTPKLISSNTLIKNAPPTTWVDVFNLNQIAGWSADLDDPNKFVSLQVTIDGVPSALLQANLYRPDLAPVVGVGNSVYHGFSFTMPALTPGVHSVALFATDVNTGAAVKAFQTTVNGSTPPVGKVQVIGDQFVGYAYDTDHLDVPLMVRLDIDNSYGTPVLAQITRLDLLTTIGSPNHGFAVDIPQLPAGAHTVRVYAFDPDTMVPALVDTINYTPPQIAANSARPRGNVDVLSATGISGWAYDADAGAAPVTVRVDVDGVFLTTFTANGARSDLASAPGVVGTAHGFSGALPTLPAGEHRIDVWVFDNPTTIPVLLKTDYINQTPPAAYFDALNTQYVYGWVQDFGNAGTPQVRLDVDGVPGNVAPANVSRGDLLSGFYFATPPLTPGSHLIQLYVIEPGSKKAVLATQGMLTAKRPVVGYVDVMNTSTISGWALDPDSGAAPVSVVVAIDGKDAIAVTADQNRPDLIPLYGSAFHGFTFTYTNNIGAGSHLITVRVVDPVTGLSTLIGSRTLIFA